MAVNLKSLYLVLAPAVIVASPINPFESPDPQPPEDLAKLKELAEKGIADSQCTLGWKYFKGEGVPKNLDDAH